MSPDPVVLEWDVTAVAWTDSRSALPPARQTHIDDREGVGYRPGGMDRRRFLFSSLAALAVPTPAGAQALPARRIGVLLVGLSTESKEAQSFRRGLREAGYIEGQNVVVEWRTANGNYDRVPDLVADLLRRRVDVIVQDSTVGTQITMRSTSTIPIVMALGVDPVGSGLVKTLARPGGNVTGLSMMTTELNGKRLQLLKELVPRLARVSVLWNPDHPFHSNVIADLKAIGPTMSLDLSFVALRTAEQFAGAFANIGGAHAQALYVVEDPIFFANRVPLMQLASKARLPMIHELRRWPVEGSVVSYGPDLYDLFRRAASYVDRILKGARPDDLPVEQPTKFELVLNLKTARGLGLTPPPALLARADQIIE